jgi:hypothetical protein
VANNPAAAGEKSKMQDIITINTLVPNPLSSLEQYLRFWHLDLAHLADNDLMDEFHALRPLLWGLPPDHWLRRRVQLLKGEMDKRSYSVKYNKTIRPKPKLAEGVKL